MATLASMRDMLKGIEKGFLRALDFAVLPLAALYAGINRAVSKIGMGMASRFRREQQ